EIGKRAIAAPLTTGRRIGSSEDIFRHYRPLMRGLRREIFKVILLDGKNTIIKDVTVSEGSLTLSLVHPREAFVPAVREAGAAAPRERGSALDTAPPLRTLQRRSASGPPRQ